MNKTLEINLCFGLVGKVVLEVQRSSILFTYMGAPHVQKIRGFFFFLIFSSFFHEFIVFMKHFVLPCAMERRESCMLTENRTCLLHGDLQKVSVFSLRSDQCKLVDYMNNFKVKSVSKVDIFCFG
jgi:hypothetical protein